MHIQVRCKECQRSTYIRLEKMADGGSLALITDAHPGEPSSGKPQDLAYYRMYSIVLSDIIAHAGGCDACGGDADVSIIGDN